MIVILSLVSSKFSRLFISIARLSSISSFISPQIFIQKSAKKIYITMNDLFHMFAEKIKSINLSHRQNRFLFSLVNKIDKFCIFIFLFASLFIIISTKTEILILYYNSAKRRPAYHVSPRFFSFSTSQTFLSTIIVFLSLL